MRDSMTGVLPLSLLLIALAAGCPPSRTGTPGGDSECDDPSITVAVETRDTGMGVNVCVWVDNGTSGALSVSQWREWSIDLCGGQPNDLTPPESLSANLEIPAGESRELLGWTTCARDAATTTDGTGSWEPEYVFYVSADPSDESCWNEARSPRLDGWYCEG